MRVAPNTTEDSSRSALPGHEVATAYDRWATQYDTDRNLTRDLDGVILQRNTSLELSNRTVLEIGCGTGKNSAWLASRVRELVAVDFSAGMLAVAQQRVPSPNVRWIQHDVRERWPVDDAGVDVVVGNLVLEHVERLEPIFAEAARVLRNDGQLYVCELHPFRQWRGGQAHFTEQSTGDTVQVNAFVHSVSDYVNAALQHGFALTHLGEWTEDDAPANSLPRLLSLQFKLEARL